MHLPARSLHLLASVLLFVILMSVLPISAFATSYLPGVVSCNWAQYRPRGVTWQSTNPILFPEPQQIKDLNATVYNWLTVTGLSQQNINAISNTYYKNGTVQTSLLTGNVETMQGNLTFAIIASGLSAPDKVWNTPTSPTLSLTAPRTVLGASRTVNFLNYTQSNQFSNSSLGFAWDQVSGIIIGASFSESINGGAFGNAQGSFTVAITNTNIWSTTPPNPDFTISTNPCSTIIQAGSSSSSTIILTSTEGFTGTVGLSALAYSRGALTTALTLSFSRNPVQLSSGTTNSSPLTIATGIDTRPGLYTVNITATSGVLFHSATLQITVPTPDFSISASPETLTVQAGNSGTSTITLASLNGLTGTISLTTDSTIAFFSPSSVTLSAGGTITSTLTVTTISSTSPATYTITITASKGSTSHTATVKVTVTQQVSNAASIFGLQPPLFYGILGVIAAVIVAAIGLALRGRKPTRPPVVPATPSETPTTPTTP